MDGDVCIVCGGGEAFDEPMCGELYRRCQSCGHEARLSQAEDDRIVNDILSSDEVYRETALDKSKRSITERVARSRGLLIDVGSASGRFLYFAKRSFSKILGIEVTPECVEFSRDKLGIPVSTTFEPPAEPFSVATFWHTMEHIPIEDISGMLHKLWIASSPDSRLIISVPNGDALLYRMFGRHFAYYDRESHLHTFSVRSLQILLSAHGFSLEQNYRSVPYESFGALQTLLNTVNRIHNFVYYRLKRGRRFPLSLREERRLMVWNYFLAAVFLPCAAALMLIGLAVPSLGAVITMSFRPISKPC